MMDLITELRQMADKLAASSARMTRIYKQYMPPGITRPHYEDEQIDEILNHAVRRLDNLVHAVARANGAT